MVLVAGLLEFVDTFQQFKDEKLSSDEESLTLTLA
jgi:hypothetical protein